MIMPLITIASLERIAAPRLAEMLRAANAQAKIAVVDVRDDDHIGGHIRTSLHFPSASLDATMPTLLRRLADKEVVVFHCALSQQRGPGAALRYLREKDVAQRKEAAASNGEAEKKTGEEEKAQKVYVLDEGFVGWQAVYGLDEQLTEGYRKDLWEEGY
ncbi:Rhodanese-like protein [Nemania diffusa]|nr:Rhodanese-like protein [Nemania diffusa]